MLWYQSFNRVSSAFSRFPRGNRRQDDDDELGPRGNGENREPGGQRAQNLIVYARRKHEERNAECADYCHGFLPRRFSVPGRRTWKMKDIPPVVMRPVSAATSLSRERTDKRRGKPPGPRLPRLQACRGEFYNLPESRPS